MTMRLAMEETIILHGGNPVRLRPSLRAAYRLESQFRLANIVKGIDECNLAIIEAILSETAADPVAAHRLLIASVDANGVRQLQNLADALIAVVAHSYGVADHLDDDHPIEHRDSVGKRFSMIQSLASLYQIATGWLGWTPDQALAASPAQIIEAHKGFVAKQRAMNGIPDDADEIPQYDPRNLPSDAEIADGVARLKALA